jgi:hypothetical protein
MKSGSRKNQVDMLKHILMCFIFLLSIGHRIIKGDATWWSWQNQSAQNPERFQEWWEETKFQECAEIYPTGQTGIAHQSDRLDLFQNKSDPPDLSGPFIRFQRCFLDMFGLGPDMSSELYDRWNLNSTGLVWPFCRNVLVLTQTCHLREFSSVSGLSWFGVTLLVRPVWWTGLLWQHQRLVFQFPIKGTPPPLMGCWFLTICITFQQPLELPHPLFVRSKFFVKDS